MTEYKKEKTMAPPKKAEAVEGPIETGWKTRISLPDNWKGSLKRATLAVEDENYPLYYRIIDGLINSIFEEEQDLIESRIEKEINPKWQKFDQYRYKERIIIQILDEGDFLRIWYDPEKSNKAKDKAGKPEFEKSKPGFVKQGDKDDTTQD